MMAIGGNEEGVGTTMSRKEKRKLLKKQKRKQVRREIAVRGKEEDEARFNDHEVQSKLRELEQEELERMERDRREFEERERRFLEALELKKKREEEEYEEEQRKLVEESRQKQVEDEHPTDEESDWEYVEDGPAEIIWQGNEIIVRKKKIRVPKKNLEERGRKEDVVRPISNPLAPQSEAFEDYKSAQELLDTVAQQVPNFGTEQDKAHCPFHLKTGACRFGTRCSRVHFYPDKSCTLLMKNMYSGPGLAWEQDEGLEHTDEEIDRSFEDFYEDVHTEFLKFGEIVNFKVCRNASPHLRGNVYVHYKSLESAVLAYHSTNGRYFAGKQVICEFVNVTRWRVAICGEFMKSRLKTCSRGSACNFIHCFRNPGGDYEWADWDKPPPRYWIKKMAALFGYSDGHDKHMDEVSPNQARSAAKSIHMDADSRYSRYKSRELDSRDTKICHDDDTDDWNSKGRRSRHMRWRRENSVDRTVERTRHKDDSSGRDASCNVYSEDDQSDEESGRINHEVCYAHKKRHRRSKRHSRSPESDFAMDRSVKDARERHHADKRNHGRSNRYKSQGSDSDRDRSVKDGRDKFHEARTSSRRKKRDSSDTDEECGSREENDQKDCLYEVNLCKHGKDRSADSKHQDDDSDLSGGDSLENAMVRKREGYHVNRRKSSERSNDGLEWSDHDSLGDGFDIYEDEYSRDRKRSSKPASRKVDLLEHSHGSHRDRHRKRESDKHRKRERSHHTSERRSSRHHKKDRAGSNERLLDEEGTGRIHKRRKESSWDQNKVADPAVTILEK